MCVCVCVCSCRNENLQNAKARARVFRGMRARPLAFCGKTVFLRQWFCCECSIQMQNDQRERVRESIYLTRFVGAPKRIWCGRKSAIWLSFKVNDSFTSWVTWFGCPSSWMMVSFSDARDDLCRWPKKKWSICNEAPISMVSAFTRQDLTTGAYSFPCWLREHDLCCVLLVFKNFRS